MARVVFPAQSARVTSGWSLAIPRSWQYREIGNRDVRLDFLRGFCLFVIIANHISFYPAFTMYLTGGGFFIVSAAEGFIFISGLVMGLVYGPRIVKDGFVAATGKIWHRAWQLYLWNLIVALAYLAIAYFTPLHTRHEAVAAPPPFNLDLVIKLLTLRESFGWSDLLATYALLVAVTPAILYFLIQKKTVWVLGLSLLLWIGYQVSPENFSPQLGTFPIFAWQLLFVYGMALGYHREDVKHFLAKWPRAMLYLPLLAAFVGLMSLGIAWTFGGAFNGDADVTWFLKEAFDKMELRLGRVLTFLVFFEVFYLALTYFWEGLNRALGWLFNPLGQNSLYVYILHGFVVSIFFNIPNYDTGSEWLHTFGHLSAVFVMWLLVKNKVLFKVIPR